MTNRLLMSAAALLLVASSSADAAQWNGPRCSQEFRKWQGMHGNSDANSPARINSAAEIFRNCHKFGALTEAQKVMLAAAGRLDRATGNPLPAAPAAGAPAGGRVPGAQPPAPQPGNLAEEAAAVVQQRRAANPNPRPEEAFNRTHDVRQRIIASLPNAGGARLDAPAPDLMHPSPASLAGSHMDGSSVAASRRQEAGSARAPFIAGPEANEPVPAGMSGRPPALSSREDSGITLPPLPPRDEPQRVNQGNSHTLGSHLRGQVDPEAEMTQEDFAAQPGQPGGSLESQIRARQAAGLNHVGTPSGSRQQAAADENNFAAAIGNAINQRRANMFPDDEDSSRRSDNDEWND